MTSVQREYDLRGMERTASIAEAKTALIDAFHTTFAHYDWTLPDVASSLTTSTPSLQGATA
jgi:lipoyl(octanoyl) transferase